MGSTSEGYIAIHEKMDSIKMTPAEVTHLCESHSAFGIYLVEELFGRFLTNSDGR